LSVILVENVESQELFKRNVHFYFYCVNMTDDKVAKLNAEKAEAESQVVKFFFLIYNYVWFHCGVVCISISLKE